MAQNFICFSFVLSTYRIFARRAQVIPTNQNSEQLPVLSEIVRAVGLEFLYQPSHLDGDISAEEKKGENQIAVAKKKKKRRTLQN